MIFKLKHKLLGGHVHVQVFSGKNEHSLGLNGNLTFREEEWNLFRTLPQRRKNNSPTDDVIVIFQEVIDEALSS